MSERLPLAGLRVLDLASFIAGPVATTVMGDHGAEVIKIEPPGDGDPQRRLGQAHSIPQHPVNFCWHLVNRNKRSVVLDLKNPEGRAAFDRLLVKRFGNWRAKFKQEDEAPLLHRSRAARARHDDAFLPGTMPMAVIFR